MADFQDELLALAGVDDAGLGNDRKRLHDELDDDLSSSSDEEKGDENDFNSKNSEVNDKESESEEDFEEKYQNPYLLEGKFKDEADRARIMAMSEIERESILFEREEEISKLMERRELAIRLRQQNNQYAAQTTRKSTRDKPLTSTAAGKRDKLTELKKRRQERTFKPDEPTFKSKKEGLTSDYEEESEKSEAEASPYSPTDLEGKDEVKVGLSDLNSIRMGRKHVAEYMYHPTFETTITGCFIRVKIGERDGKGVYRLCQVKGISEGRKPYRVEGVLTKTYLECYHGKSKRVFEANVLSNEPFTESDFQRWCHQMAEDKLSMPSKSFIERKLDDLKQMTQYVLNETEVSDIIRRKKELSRVPSNLAAEKTRLRQHRQAAIAANNTELAKELEERLNTLQELSVGNAPQTNFSAMDQLAKVNERNRRRNQAEVRLAEKRMNEERRRLATSVSTSATSLPSLAIADSNSKTSTPSVSASGVSTPQTDQNLSSNTPSASQSQTAVSFNTTPKLSPSDSHISINEPVPPPADREPATLAEKEARLREKAVHGIDDLIATVDFGIDINI
ncbi:RNA polymerase II associated Paf1 complex [Schizosaccharomyces cryophilus OY26]|uniref:RNA polymerase II associated Paf1 complex n=1 Tax=Schizosaccharomyces cryophilus (strain OY26 / ATCC MYA-4695 / CBS 11777 / NBRC 106824 / NRRL Y48691) TaxID=653667 RepID=S9VT88_SCHCR|nr:RNA polymerase II associated Paf1 complex [Schizosaccharomyces cryophilus OY26]EPY49319.1 RNA polymerase II associated Paf1 complex [Schizosaccharomyces cryophilus OY26]